MKVTVVGLGYVGLPLAVAACNAGFTVYGLDNDRQKVAKLNSGKTFIEDLSDEKIKNVIKSRNFIPTIDPNVISESKIVLICVPTPLNKSRQPDLTSVIDASITVGKNLKIGSLVIVESTIEPRTCRETILPILIEESGLKMGEFELAYSPERIDPTNKEWGITNTAKLVAGMTNNASEKAFEFYNKFIDLVIKCSSIEIAETAKLLENSFRFINISFINELAIYCHKNNIDIVEVISAASTKPYGFMPFYPGLGIGGHCIPVDPIYLANSMNATGVPSRFIDLAVQVNKEIPDYFISRAKEILGEFKNKRVLVVGISYKPNVSDVRESPSIVLIGKLVQNGAQVFWHDDVVKEWNGELSTPLSSDFDLVILTTPHEYLDLTKLGEVPILNTRGSI
jgi:nucleotide sugar dehydrogenase